MQPLLTTTRLVLRPFTLADAPRVQALAGAREVAAPTANLPHPYADGMAEQWIARHAPAFTEGRGATFAIIQAATSLLIGAVGLVIDPQHRHAELGYWLGVAYWNQGYGTEAARAVVDYGFRDCSLQRIFSSHMTRNPASGRIMQKLGMRYEGCLRQHFYKWGVFEDIVYYGLLRDEWQAQQALESAVASAAHDHGPQALVDGFVRAWNAHDGKLFARLFAEDADWVTVTGIRVKTRAEIQAFLEREHATWAQATTMRATNIDVRLPRPDLAVMYLHWEIAAAVDSQGKPVNPARGVTLLVAANQPADGWAIVAGQSSRQAPAQ